MYQIARTEASHNNNLEHISHWRKIQAQILLKHNYQAHNSECNVEVSCHELQTSDERSCVQKPCCSGYTIFLLYNSAGAEVKGRAGLPNDKNN